MGRIIVALGVLVVVFCGVSSLAAEPPAVQGPLHVFSWSAAPGYLPNITPLLRITSADKGVAALARASRRVPQGDAALLLWQFDGAYPHGLLHNPEDAARTPDGKLTHYLSPWISHGTARLKAAADHFFHQYKTDGGRLDYFILDFEDGYCLRAWQLPVRTVRAIQRDPRSEALAAQLGFHNFLNIKQVQNGAHYFTWNSMEKRTVDGALNTALFDVARKYYPSVKGCNFGDFILTRRNAVHAPSWNDQPQFQYSYVGTAGSPELYGSMGVAVAGDRFGGAKPYGNRPFAILRWQLNLLRGIARSSDVPLLPWISSRRFDDKYKPANAFRDSRYYRELIYHTALSGASELFYFNPKPWLKTQDPADWASNANDRLVNRLVARLNRKLGDLPRRAITLAPIPWNSKVVATGMRITGKGVLWRVTVPPETRAVRVVEAGGGAKTIPLGRGRIGFWYESRPGQNVTFTPLPRRSPNRR